MGWGGELGGSEVAEPYLFGIQYWNTVFPIQYAYWSSSGGNTGPNPIFLPDPIQYWVYWVFAAAAVDFHAESHLRWAIKPVTRDLVFRGAKMAQTWPDPGRI